MILMGESIHQIWVNVSCVLQVSHYERRIRTLEADLRESKEQRKRALDEVLNTLHWSEKLKKIQVKNKRYKTDKF